MNKSDVKPDLPVYITPYRDLMFDFDLRPFITTYGELPKIFPVIKWTKGGLIEIQVTPKQRIVVPPCNVELWDVNDPVNQVAVTENFINLVKALGV